MAMTIRSTFRPPHGGITPQMLRDWLLEVAAAGIPDDAFLYLPSGNAHGALSGSWFEVDAIEAESRRNVRVLGAVS